MKPSYVLMNLSLAYSELISAKASIPESKPLIRLNLSHAIARLGDIANQLRKDHPALPGSGRLLNPVACGISE